MMNNCFFEIVRDMVNFLRKGFKFLFVILNLVSILYFDIFEFN